VLVQAGLVLEEHVEPKEFQVQGEEAEGVLEEEAKEWHEFVQVDWDTGENIYIKLCEKYTDVLYQHTTLG
jgi:hypothetical protein